MSHCVSLISLTASKTSLYRSTRCTACQWKLIRHTRPWYTALSSFMSRPLIVIAFLARPLLPFVVAEHSRSCSNGAIACATKFNVSLRCVDLERFLAPIILYLITIWGGSVTPNVQDIARYLRACLVRKSVIPEGKFEFSTDTSTRFPQQSPLWSWVFHRLESIKLWLLFLRLFPVLKAVTC